MGQRRKSAATVESAAVQEMRNQEVLRANRELAAYFKGGRTEREARAALKTIKAFVRDRERRDAGSRPPLPGADAAKPLKEGTKRDAGGDGKRHKRKARRKRADKPSGEAFASIEPQDQLESAPASDDPALD